MENRGGESQKPATKDAASAPTTPARKVPAAAAAAAGGTMGDTAAGPTANPSPPPTSPRKYENPLACKLRRGDLVRISEAGRTFSKRLKDRYDDGALGRITRVATSREGGEGEREREREEELHDVEWVLGGRVAGVHRPHLIRTTADQEGMTQEHLGKRRCKRKPSETGPSSSFTTTAQKQSTAAVANDQRPATQQAGPQPAQNKAKKKKGQPTKAKAAGGKAKTKMAKGAKGKSKAAPASSTTNKPAAAGAGKKRKRTEGAGGAASNKSAPAGTGASGGTAAASAAVDDQFDLYQRQKREFERIVTRLEKADKFGFFLDDAPPEYDETYDDDGYVPFRITLPEQQQTGPGPADESMVTEPVYLTISSEAVAAGTKTKDYAETTTTASTTADPMAVEAGIAAEPTNVEGTEARTEEGGAGGGGTKAPPPKPVSATATTATAEPTTTNNTASAQPGKKTYKRKKPFVFPPHAPYNWQMIRRRMAHGRYVLDREYQEEDERFAAMRPYYATLEKGERPKRKFAHHKWRASGTSATVNPRILYKQGVDWNAFRDDVVAMCDAAIERQQQEHDEEEKEKEQGINGDSIENGSHDELEDEGKGSLNYAAKQIKETVLTVYERTGCRHMEELSLVDDRHKFDHALKRQKNEEAAMQSWRKVPFPERRYERLAQDAVCAGLDPVDERIASYERRTQLENSFVGLSYKYNDTGQSEAWMKSVVDETGPTNSGDDRVAAMAIAADEGVIRAQVATTMQHLLIGVQDRVMTEAGVLRQNELRSANWIESAPPPPPSPTTEGQPNCSPDSDNPDVVEQPVWGIDRYTRRNISVCLETEFDKDTALVFIEKWLLPAINACPEDLLAHNISNASRILEGQPLASEQQKGEGKPVPAQKVNPLRRALDEKIKTAGPPWLQLAANLIRRARESLGPDFFRVHPKGHGSVLLSSVKANSLVTFYRGELYPSWRWGEKMDAIDITQQRKHLKPALPDFYNMVLERPQSDPRGYGILYVDASRKAGHGSSLSHSCAPTCEVRVAARNGELCLAMTTLRELEMGEELTFDYNAVTESLNEYSSAVCLCGYGKCRGAFLHFAAADCYQQILNRNAPIASRFAWLVKGSMKQVMAEDDDRMLRSHGFLTAAFGAIGVNRREAPTAGESETHLEDSIDYVPVWLRTFVADTLRYIEYERRALPIALICDHLSTANRNVVDVVDVPDSSEKEKVERVSKIERVSKEPTKALPSFFYFTTTQSDFLMSLLKKQGFPDTITGMQRKHAMLKLASAYWQELPEEKRLYWKNQSIADFEKRKKLWQSQNAKAIKPKASAKAPGKAEKKVKPKSKPEISDVLLSSKISFQDADAEGVAAMEQRVQQLTQALSRIGRLLDRHRELSFEKDPGLDRDRESYSSSLRKRVYPPLAVAPDEKVIGWMWNSRNGAVISLLDSARNARCTRPSLLEKLQVIRTKYSDLESFGDPTDAFASPDAAAKPKISPAGGRVLLKEALCGLRMVLLAEIKDMGKLFRKYRSLVLQKESSKEQEEEKEVVQEDEGQGEVDEGSEEPTEEDAGSERLGADEGITSDRALSPTEAENETGDSIVSCIVENLIQKVERQVGMSTFAEPASTTSATTAQVPQTSQTMLDQNPWLEFYNERSMLLAAADLLSFYAHTSNYFFMRPYSPLTSTPIEVYARELGNAVPRSAMDTVPCQQNAVVPSGASPDGDCCEELKQETATPSAVTQGGECCPKASGAPQPKAPPLDDELCEPDDIIANVSVSYNGDYVLSQLLQWYNGGIGLKTGLPDILGCILLPEMPGCWSIHASGPKKKAERRITTYETKVRPRLIEWLRDPYQRGSPWPEEVQTAFVAKDDKRLQTDTSSLFLPFGSPIIDFLVTGDESNIATVLNELDADDKVAAKKNADGMLLSVDKGRPAQAVSNWVQCENPDCLKWRRIPWHVDIDLLPETFCCKDNLWNPSVNYCGAPEEDWDEDDKLVGGDGKVEGSPVKKDPNASLSPLDENNFYTGARFDVLRKKKFTTAAVALLDLSGQPKRIKFHFHKTRAEADEWIEFGSPRIAALYSKSTKPKPKAAKQLPLLPDAQSEALPGKNGVSSEIDQAPKTKEEAKVSKPNASDEGKVHAEKNLEIKAAEKGKPKPEKKPESKSPKEGKAKRGRPRKDTEEGKAKRGSSKAKGAKKARSVGGDDLTVDTKTAPKKPETLDPSFQPPLPEPSGEAVPGNPTFSGEASVLSQLAGLISAGNAGATIQQSSLPVSQQQGAAATMNTTTPAVAAPSSIAGEDYLRQSAQQVQQILANLDPRGQSQSLGFLPSAGQPAGFTGVTPATSSFNGMNTMAASASGGSMDALALLALASSAEASQRSNPSSGGFSFGGIPQNNSPSLGRYIQSANLLSGLSFNSATNGGGGFGAQQQQQHQQQQPQQQASSSQSVFNSALLQALTGSPPPQYNTNGNNHGGGGPPNYFRR